MATLTIAPRVSDQATCPISSTASARTAAPQAQWQTRQLSSAKPALTTAPLV